ncbi:MAG: cysteine desulfurase [Anaerolineaceae bacterium]|nr:cysteine desulfurase [Anaerolineae bacterium]MBL1172402.1 cysteine desulfurase [Chloroflexota bacterium]MCZ2289336.1 cysteine desulfurase [Anaerolineales bacterium]MDL1926696.1 cysteine desulfurase [Anaerolineae bacterium AMX1]GJQ38594.1 MAG: cysteine desulfurase [Anaerolineaceae bacterium]
MLDADLIRADFPILERRTASGARVTYLDSTATSQKPLAVIEAMNDFYRRSNANIHRGVHTLAEESTALYEQAREKVAKFINAESARQIVYTRNTTESINLVAYTWARANLKAGDLIVLTEMEHHSNLVPWHMLAAERGVELDFIPVTADGLLDLDAYRSLLTRDPKLVAFTQMSNVLGTVNPAAEIVRLAREVGAATLVDAAQSAPHLAIDAQAIGADFIAFSAHKMCGPTGIGALYGRAELLESMPPFLGGGDMIREVKLRSFRPNSIPHKFEAGTPAIAEAVGFGAAVDYLAAIGMDKISAHEHEIIEYALERLEEIPGVKVFGPSADKKGAVASFTLDGVHPHDVAQILDRDGIAVRAGHHCAQPLHEKFGIPATSRASFYLYNTRDEVDLLVNGIYKVKKLFG